MSTSRIIAKIQKAYENGEDTTKIEEMLTVILSNCLEDQSFYQLPIEAINRIIKRKEEKLTIEDATKIIKNLYNTKGFATVGILESLDCGNIGYKETADILLPLRNVPFIHELLSAKPTNARVKFENSEFETKIEELEANVIKLRKENSDLKKRLHIKGPLGMNDPDKKIKMLEDKLALLAPIEDNIIEAVENENLQIVNYFAALDPKCINEENQEGYTPLQMAALKDNFEIAEYLVKRGADINHLHSKNDTCLHFAALSNGVEIGELLLDNGADISIADDDGFQAIHYAAQSGSKKFAKMLVKRGVDPKVEANGTTTFWLACESGDIATVAFFMDQGVDQFKPNPKGYTPLHAASMSGNTDIVDVLLDIGISIDAKSNDGKTALDVAADEEMKIFLEEHGAKG